MPLGTYLRNCRARLAAINTKEAYQTITLVFGNESADLDSCVSSISYGYLQTAKASPKQLIVPVLNIPRADVKLRAELLLLLKNNDLSEADLICRDDLATGSWNASSHDLTTNALPGLVQNAAEISFVLVDHNNFEVEGFPSNDVHVTGLIDHHVDEGLYLNANPRIIETSGSCTSLVVTYFKDLWESGSMAAESQLTKMALSAVCLRPSME